MIASPRVSAYIQDIKLINERQMKISLQMKNQKYHFYQIYAPQQGLDEAEKIEFMNTLEENYEGRPDDINVLMGDFNARVGADRSGIEQTMGPFGEETKNEEGENLIDFCVRNNLKIMNGFFKHREQHIYTRYRWNRNTGQFDQKSIIDYIITSDKRFITNVKVLPGVSFDSDHRLVVGHKNTERQSTNQTKVEHKKQNR